MRKKEGNVDYKFFPEPNITPIRLSDELDFMKFRKIWKNFLMKENLVIWDKTN